MADNEENTQEIVNENEETPTIIEENETKNEDIKEITNDLQSGKPKKERTEKQKLALKKAQETRRISISRRISRGRSNCKKT